MVAYSADRKTLRSDSSRVMRMVEAAHGVGEGRSYYR